MSHCAWWPWAHSVARGSRSALAVQQREASFMVKLLPVVWQGCRIFLLQALFLGLFLEFGETKMVPLWSGNYDLIWPARERCDAAYSMGTVSLLGKVTERSAS